MLAFSCSGENDLEARRNMRTQPIRNEASEVRMFQRSGSAERGAARIKTVVLHASVAAAEVRRVELRVSKCKLFINYKLEEFSC